MSSNTPRPNAFTIGRYGGTEPGSFPDPFRLSCHQVARVVYQLGLSPLRVVDICDLLGPYEAMAVRAYGSDGLLGLCQVATKHSIECGTLDVDMVVVPTSGLGTLFQNLTFVDLEAFDLPANYALYETGSLIAQHRTWASAVLPDYGKSRVFLSSHDDCWLALESYDLSLPQAVFGRALRIYAGTMLAERAGLDELIAEVPTAIVQALCSEDAELTILQDQTYVLGDRVKINAWRRDDWNWNETWPHTPELVIEYQFRKSEWSLLSS